MRADLIFRVSLLMLFIAFIAHRAYYTRRLGRRDEPTTEPEDRSAATRLATLLSVPALLATLVYIVNPRWIAWGTIAFPGWVRWSGVGIALLGFGLLQWAQQALGDNWSDTPRLVEGQTLVTAGPYRRIRHPIYTAFLLIMSAPLLISANWVVGFLWLALTALAVRSRVVIEELLMLAQFGDRYREYMRETGRLLPLKGNWRT